MKKVELLSPAGNMECLKSAAQNGCDAVYVSGKRFGARKFAENFTIEELEEATKYCHIYDVKIYVTVNTIIYENELEDVLSYVEKLYQFGVDAFIMQDLGLIASAKKRFPDIVIHASTQAHNHNDEGLKFLKELGVERVVLARELSLEEIKNLKTPIEKEIFIHGALCVCYSGECLFSSIMLNRSGNRGECAGICRLPFQLIENNKKRETNGNYLLSPKELCTITNLDKILDTDITSLKIEGRMKSKEYVGYITRLYRRKIDAYYQNKKITLTNEEESNLKILYNRDFTLGYLFNQTKKDFINQLSPNHQGLEIGKIIEIKDKLKIKLDYPLNQYDGIRFANNEGGIVNYLYDKNMNLINKAQKDEIVYLDNKWQIKELGIIKKTTDYELIKEIEQTPNRKVKIKMTYSAKKDEPFTLTIEDNKNKITKQGVIVLKALNNPVDKKVLEQKLRATGNTPFEVETINGDIENDVFFPMSKIKELRRELIDELLSLRTTPILKIVKPEPEKVIKQQKTYEIAVLVNTEAQVEALKNSNFILYTNDKAIYNKYKNELIIYYRTPRVFSNIYPYEDERLLLSEIGSIHKLSFKNNAISDCYLNVVNHKTISLLKEKNIKKIGLSWELKDNNLTELMKHEEAKYSNLEIPIYGRVELMIMKHCPVNTNLNKDKNSICNLCHQNKYELEDRNHKRYPINSNNCINTILNFEPINRISKINEYENLGITNFRVELFDETKEETIKIINQIKQNLQNSTKYELNSFQK